MHEMREPLERLALLVIVSDNLDSRCVFISKVESILESLRTNQLPDDEAAHYILGMNTSRVENQFYVKQIICCRLNTKDVGNVHISIRPNQGLYNVKR